MQDTIQDVEQDLSVSVWMGVFCGVFCCESAVNQGVFYRENLAWVKMTDMRYDVSCPFFFFLGELIHPPAVPD